MALETSGFQLSQFDRAPNVPGNIGVVDTKGIYGAVTDALKAHEALRTTQQVQKTTDAELAFQQRKAETEMGLLGPEAEARQAKANLFSAAAPYQMGQLGLQSQADESKLRADIARNTVLSQPGVAEQAVLGKILTPREREIRNLSARYQDPNTTEMERNAIAIQLKQAVDAETAEKNALAERKMMSIRNPDGTVGFAPQYGPASSDVAPTGGGLFAPVGPIATPPSGLLARPAATPGARSGAPAGGPLTKMDVAAQQGAQKAVLEFGEDAPLVASIGTEGTKAYRGYNVERLAAAQKAISAQQANLDTYRQEESKDRETQASLEALIKEAEEKGIMISGGGLIGRGIRAVAPGELANFQSRLTGVLADVQLGNMLRLKNASATGATGFGNLTENEGKILRSDFGDLEKTDLSTEAMVAALQRTKTGMERRRQEALGMIRSKLSRERTVESQSALNAYRQAGAPTVLLPVHDLETAPSAAPETAAPTAPTESLFPSSGSMAPAGLTFSPQAAPATTPAPETAAPAAVGKYTAVTPAATPAAAPTTPGNFKNISLSPAPGKASNQPAPAAPEAPSEAPSIAGAARALVAENTGGRSGVMETLAAPGRVIDQLERYARAGIKGVATGDYSVPEKGMVTQAGEAIGEALSGESVGEMRERFRREDEIIRTKPNSWAAYEARRNAGRPGPAPAPKTAAPAPAEAPAETPAKTPDKASVLKTELPEPIPMSKETRDIAQRVYDEYLANKPGEKPPSPVLSSGREGSRARTKLDDRSLWAILSNPTEFSRLIRDDGLRGEFDMAASRAMMDARMRRAEQMRAYEAANPARGARR